MQVVAIPLRNETSAEDSPYETQSDAQQVAYAICGFNGFVAQINVKPTLGARLIRINGTPIEEAAEKWNSVEAVEAAIVSQNRSISLTFRNDHWNKTQKEKLQVAIQKHSQRSSQAIASSVSSDAADIAAAAKPAAGPE